MTIINFTVNFDALASQPDSGDDGIDADIIPLIGDVTFTPQFSDDNFVLAADYSPRPAGFKPRAFTGYLDSDGQLKASRGGAVGVRLWANDPVFNLASLAYRVDWHLTTPIGEAVRIAPSYFLAPSSDTPINLADVLSPTRSFGGIPIIGGSIGDGTVTFENSDGSFVQPIEIPNGALVFLDNGDSTWSIG